MSSGLQTCTSPAQNVFLPQTVTAGPDMSPNPSSPALSTTSNSSGTAKKSEPPKRLRYWLIDMIESGEIPGLRWENADRTIFRIPWKHAGKNNWKEEDCRIFQEWAIHRGKYKAGDKVDPATWKTRLRCALNKLGDIKELKHRSNLEGNDPFRVYQLMPEQDKTQEPEIYPREEWTRECNLNYRSSSPGGAELPDYVASCHQDNIRRMTTAIRLTPFQDLANGNVSHQQQFGLERKPVQDVRHLNGNPFHEHNSNPTKFRSPSNEFNGHRNNYANEAAQMMGQGRRQAYGQSPSPVQQLSPMNPVASPLAYNSEATNFNMETVESAYPQEMAFTTSTMEYQMPLHPPQPFEMDVFIRYRGNDVAYHHIDIPSGCRAYYGDANLQLIAVQTHQLPSGIFGPESLYQIGFPDCEPFSVSSKQVTLTKHVLNNIKRGLILFYEDGCFYTRRLCQSRVFIFGPETQGDTPEKLDRDVKVKVFDFKKFHDGLQRYAKGRSKLPEIELKASFGQNWSIKTPIDKNLVTLYMIPRLATYYINKIREQYKDEESIDIMKSVPDSYDHLVDISEKKTDSLLTELLRNIDPNMFKPFSDVNTRDTAIGGPPHAPLSNGPSAASTSSFVSGGAFQRNVLNIAPLAIDDVEMG